MLTMRCEIYVGSLVKRDVEEFACFEFILKQLTGFFITPHEDRATYFVAIGCLYPDAFQQCT